MKKISGLTKIEVENRIRDNKVNYDTSVKTKSIRDIIISNSFTLFNIINILLALLLVIVGSYKNTLFIFIIIINSLISIIQEVRSKRELDKLKVIASNSVLVLRDGIEEEIHINDIVLDDIIIFNNGNQVVVDSIVVDGEVEVNESFITGEAKTIYKKKGDKLLSGSFIVSGRCLAEVEHVGLDNYVAKISSNTKYSKPVSSEIMRSLNRIVSTISFIIIPVGILLFSSQYSASNNFNEAITSTVAGIIGMIPEGLVLLTSTVLAVSVIKLSKEKVLVQDLYCIEMLARVDVACLDKTGTITEGKLEVVRDISFNNRDISYIISNINGASIDSNPTALALLDKYGKSNDKKVEEVIPFSSSRKYSGVKFSDITYVVGAPEFILKDNYKKYEKIISPYLEDYRVLMVGEYKKNIIDTKLVGLILIQDKIRESAPSTIEYFKKQEVDLKIISGDDARSVLGIAKRAGFSDDTLAINATVLETDQDILEAVSKYSVFGRVTPDQKRKFILALQKLGHSVLMGGDGVNDVLALKEADASVAMNSGADAAKNVSQLILLDSDFSSVPDIVAEGRRTINNIERSASLFIVKTIYTFLLVFLFINTKSRYPFIPIQLSLLSTLTIGIPSFVLALEFNNNIVKRGFLLNVIKKALPTSVLIVFNILIIYLFGMLFSISSNEISTMCVIISVFIGFMHLYNICNKNNIIHRLLIVVLVLVFLISYIFFKEFFSFTNISITMGIIIVLLVIESVYLYKYFIGGLDKLIDFIKSRKIKNK
jgi:HAD ATPase, P-type, family IC